MFGIHGHHIAIISTCFFMRFVSDLLAERLGSKTLQPRDKNFFSVPLLSHISRRMLIGVHVVPFSDNCSREQLVCSEPD